MAWCSHCIVFCETQVSGQFVSCSRCGKVLAEVLAMLKFSKSEKVRSKGRRRRKKKRDQTLGIDRLEFCLHQEHKKVEESSRKYLDTISTCNFSEESACSSQPIYDDQVLFSTEESTASNQS